MTKTLPALLEGIALLHQLGPGIITGAADDDPSGIATYSQGGAQFGFNLLWTLLLTYPLMVAIQMISARIGRTTGHGLARNMSDAVSRLAGDGAEWSLLFLASTPSMSAPTWPRWAKRPKLVQRLQRSMPAPFSSRCFRWACSFSFPIAAMRAF